MRKGYRRVSNLFERNDVIQPYIFTSDPASVVTRACFGSFWAYFLLFIVLEVLRFFEKFNWYLLRLDRIDRFVFNIAHYCDTQYFKKKSTLLAKAEERIHQSEVDMEEIVKRGLPAQAVAMKEATVLKKKLPRDPLKDEIPKGTSLYEQNSRMFSFLRKSGRSKSVSLDMIPGNEIVEMKHLDVGTLTPGQNEVIDIKLVPDEALPRVSMTDFQRSGRNRPSQNSKAVHVGAIEVIFDSYASPDSDIVGGMLLVDTGHTRVENAVRSVFVTGLAGGRPIRVLLFPDTLVEINENMNKRFKLVCTTSNGDFAPGFNLAAVKVNIVGCTVSLSRSYTPSEFLDVELKNEKATVVEYLGRTSYVMHNTNVITPEKMQEQTLDFKLDSTLQLQQVDKNGAMITRANSLRFVVGGNHGGLKSMLARGGVTTSQKNAREGRHSVDLPSKVERKLLSNEYVDPVEGEITMAYGQANGEPNVQELFDRDPVLRGPPSHTRVARTVVRLPKILSGGTVLFEDKLANILVSTKQRATISFERSHVMRRKLVALATLGVPENTGLCLMMCYNSSIRGKATVDAYTASSQASHIWNPACKQSAKLEINPNPCKPSWSYQYLRQSNCHFAVACISGWTTTPMTDLSMTIDWYFDDKDCEPDIYCLGGNFENLTLNRWMGRLTFEQGTEIQLKRMPLAIGGGAGGTGKIYMNMPNALCSMWRYIHGGIEFEIIKMSSPYIKSTIAFFIAFTDVDAKTENLEAYPHKLVQFGEVQERVVLIFDKDDFAMAWSSQVRSNTPPDQIGCPYLYAVTHDSTGSTLAGDFNLGVVMKRMLNFSGIGRNPGWVGAFPLQVEAQALRKTKRGVYNKMFEVRVPPEAKADEIIPFAFDLIGIGISVPSRGAWSLVTYNSPINNLLRTATWKQGTIHFQLIMEGNSTVKRADWASYTDVSLSQSLQKRALPTREWTMKDPHSWELEFEVTVAGPNEGFESWENQWANQTSWILELAVFNPDQSTVFHVNGYLQEDFCCAGNTLMPAFVEPDQAKTRKGSLFDDLKFDYGTLSSPKSRTSSVPLVKEQRESLYVGAGHGR